MTEHVYYNLRKWVGRTWFTIAVGIVGYSFTQFVFYDRVMVGFFSVVALLAWWAVGATAFLMIKAFENIGSEEDPRKRIFLYAWYVVFVLILSGSAYYGLYRADYETGVRWLAGAGLWAGVATLSFTNFIRQYFFPTQ